SFLPPTPYFLLPSLVSALDETAHLARLQPPVFFPAGLDRDRIVHGDFSAAGRASDVFRLVLSLGNVEAKGMLDRSQDFEFGHRSPLRFGSGLGFSSQFSVFSSQFSTLHF